jgi:hypothetical protein
MIPHIAKIAARPKHGTTHSWRTNGEADTQFIQKLLLADISGVNIVPMNQPNVDDRISTKSEFRFRSPA